MRDIVDRGFPYMVAEVDGQVAGYAYANTYRGRIAYQWTVENSVYVDAAFQGRGVGTALLQAPDRCLRRTRLPADGGGDRRADQHRLDQTARTLRFPHRWAFSAASAASMAAGWTPSRCSARSAMVPTAPLRMNDAMTEPQLDDTGDALFAGQPVPRRRTRRRALHPARHRARVAGQRRGGGAGDRQRPLRRGRGRARRTAPAGADRPGCAGQARPGQGDPQGPRGAVRRQPRRWPPTSAAWPNNSASSPAPNSSAR